MIKEVTLDKVYVNETDANGAPNLNKKGRAYTMVNIFFKTEDGEEVKAGMYCDNEWNSRKINQARGWNTGDKVTLDFEKNGDFVNFDIPSKTALLEIRLADLEKRVEKLEK